MAQSTPAALAPCTVRTTPPSPAELALFHDDNNKAETLFQEEMKTGGKDADRAHLGYVQALLAQDRKDDAETEALKWTKADPKSSWAFASLAKVYLYEAKMDLVVSTIQTAGSLDRCNMELHVDFAFFSEITGMHATAKKHLDVAHQFEPLNPEINAEWVRFQPRAVRLQHVEDELKNDKSLTQREKDYLERSKQSLAHPESSCRMTSKPESVTIPLHGIKDGPTGKVEWGFVIGFNGVERRLELDTGASGLFLTHKVAAAMHLNSEGESYVYGIGDGKRQKVMIATVKELKIGNLVFENCKVEVPDADIEGMQDIDGLIGGDMFRDFLLTLDYPGRQMKLDMLRQEPGSASAPVELSDDSESSRGPQDAYQAPTMKDWSSVFRLGHELLMPTTLNNKLVTLFLIDTGSDATIISDEAAKQVTKLHAAPEYYQLYGVSGKTKTAQLTDEVKLGFAHLQYPAYNLMAFEPTSMLGHEEVRVSGILGAGILRQLTIHIDYRDNLVQFQYDPKRITPCMPGVYREDCY